MSRPSRNKVSSCHKRERSRSLTSVARRVSPDALAEFTPDQREPFDFDPQPRPRNWSVIQRCRDTTAKELRTMPAPTRTPPEEGAQGIDLPQT